MKRRLRDFIVKLFSLVLAIIMCIPTNVYALGIGESEEDYPTIMTEDDNTIDSETDPIIEEEKSEPKLETEASLDEANVAIIYKVKLTGLAKDKETRLSLGLNKNQDLKSLAVREVKDLDTGDSIDFEEAKDEERKDLVSLSVNTIDTPNLEYIIEAKIDKDNIDDKKFYSMDISVDNGEENIFLERVSHKFIEEESKEDPEVKELVLSKVKASADDLRKISIKKNEEDNKDYITYSDYIISKEKSSDLDDSNREITYNISIDENQDPSTAEIALEYYKASETGFIVQKEFSSKIPYQEETKIDLPAGYLLKITYTNQVDPKNTKAKSYSVNNRELKNPHFVKEENKSTKEDDPLPEENKEEKNKTSEDKKTTEKIDEEQSKDKKDVADKSSKENKEENKKEEKQSQEKSEEKTKEEKNPSDKKAEGTKTPAEEKTNKNGLSESQSKNAVADFEEELDKQTKESSKEQESSGVLNTIKNVFGMSDLQKADRKLKAALKDEANGLVEIQNLLTSLGSEYNLSRSDQAKLLADNEDAIKALIEKDANINFDPSLLFARTNETNTSNLEEGRDDVVQIIDPGDSNYEVNTDAYANPVIEDGKLQGYNWTIKVSSDTDLNALGLNVNFTEVVGSGLREIEKNNVDLENNPIKGAFGIHDSKHHAPGAGIKDITYNFYTGVQGMQEKYIMDISIILTAKNKVGAKRFVMDGWPADKVKEATPIRAGMNNRTTILGEFTSESAAKWTVTDAVSTGDDKGTKENPADTKLPWETRRLSKNQTLQEGQVAVYKIGSDGKMVQDGETQTVSEIPGKRTNPGTNQAVGTIAVYEYNTSINDDKEPQTLGGVAISRYEDIDIDQHWNLPQGYEKMPAQDINVVDKSGNNLGSVHVDAQENSKQRLITVPNVKVWNIQGERKFTKTQPKIVQTFPTNNVTIGTKEYKYNENTSYYNYNDKNHFILNSLMEVDNKTPATFKIVKVDSKTGEKLQGASFHLLGTGVSVVTDANGEATFTNIPP